MANHGSDDLATDVAGFNTSSPDWANGGKLLLVGVTLPGVVELTELFRQSRRVVPSLRLCHTATEALGQLTDEAFDCILVVNSTGDLTQAGVDAQGFCQATRAAGCTDAILVLTGVANDGLWRAACETDAELYVGRVSWRSSTLLMLIDRALHRRTMARDSQRRRWTELQRVDRERADCTELLQQQRQLLQETPIEQFGSIEAILPPELPLIYREVLRTYVMTGTVNLASEIKKLAQTFALAHLTPRQVLQLHLDQVEPLVKGIGQRSARHIMDRANVLCLELMVLLCECLAEQNARTWWAWRRQPVADLGLSLERRAA